VTPLCSTIAAHPDERGSGRAALWRVVGALVMPIIPSPAYGVRRRVLAFFGATLDPHARIRGGVRISHPWNLTMGRKSSIGEGAWVYNPQPLTIGARTVLSQYCLISCAARDGDPRSADQHPAPITIGNDVWIAAECVVEGGVRVPNGVLVGARALVNADSTLEPWTIATGHPARSVRERPYRGVKS